MDSDKSFYKCKCGIEFSVLKSLEKHLRKIHNHWPERDKTDAIKQLVMILKNESVEKAKVQTIEEKIKINSGFEEYKNAFFPMLAEIKVSESTVLKLSEAKTFEELKNTASKILKKSDIEQLNLWGFNLKIEDKSKKIKSSEGPKIKILYTPMGNKR